MNKQEFLARLREGLSGLPPEDAEGRLSFYSEMLDDRMEEGLSEEEAVAGLGSIDDIVSQTIADIPLPRLVKERIKPKRRLRTWEIVLLIAGAPVWLPLLIAAIAVLLSVYVTIWSLLNAVQAAEISLIAGVLSCAVMSVVYFGVGYGAQALVVISAGLVLAGLSIFLFFGCKAAAVGTVRLTKKFALWIKSWFVRKEVAQ